MRYVLTLVGLTLLSMGTACRSANWQLRMPSRQVALALGDPLAAEVEGRFDPNSVPVIDPPKGVRPCCPLGTDIKIKVGTVTVPLYKKGNVLAPDDMGRHEYDNGFLTVQGNPARVVLIENNGLVYSCRGGVIDVAHVRDNADLTLFLALALARGLPGPIEFDLPEQGTKRRVRVKALPEGTLERHGRWSTATAMAQWIAYQMSIWHEVVTWYDWQSIKGFSEKLSAFSPEDMYSNALGTRIGAGIILTQGARSRDDYNRSMDAWLPEMLRILSPLSLDDTRTVLKALDGLWWDSRVEIPDWKLVLHRNLAVNLPLSPWLASEAKPEEKDKLATNRMCAGKPPALALSVPERIGRIDFTDSITIEFAFTPAFMPDGLPTLPGKRLLTHADIPAVIEGIRKEMAKELPPGFDKPKASPIPSPEAQPVANAARP